VAFRPQGGNLGVDSLRELETSGAVGSGSTRLKYILFFVIAKPVDSAVTGTLNVLTSWLAKRK